MPRESGRNDTRSRIAYLAARLMAEDGIEDYALAKRKAARQAGLADARALPTNEEIAEALKIHQAIYQETEHRERVRALRERAVRAMRELGRFEPYLTGSVLAGNAGKYADINLHLYTEHGKHVELFLMERGIPYRAGQARYYAGTEQRIVPVFTIEDDGVEIEIAVLTSLDLRQPVRTSPDGKAIERLRIDGVERLLQEC